MQYHPQLQTIQNEVSLWWVTLLYSLGTRNCCSSTMTKPKEVLYKQNIEEDTKYCTSRTLKKTQSTVQAEHWRRHKVLYKQNIEEDTKYCTSRTLKKTQSTVQAEHWRRHKVLYKQNIEEDTKYCTSRTLKKTQSHADINQTLTHNFHHVLHLWRLSWITHWQTWKSLYVKV